MVVLIVVLIEMKHGCMRQHSGNSLSLFPGGVARRVVDNDHLPRAAERVRDVLMQPASGSSESFSLVGGNKDQCEVERRVGVHSLQH